MEEKNKEELKIEEEGFTETDDILSRLDDNDVKEEWSSSSSLRDLLGLAPLLTTVERQIVSILLARGLVKVHAESDSVDDYTFDNVEITTKGQILINNNSQSKEIEELVSTLGKVHTKVLLNNSTKVNLTDEQVENYRLIFPVGSRGPGSKIVRHRLEKFMSEHDCSYDELCNAAKYYIRHNSSKGYNIMGSHFFLYKRDQQSKVDESKAEEFLEQYRTAHVEKDWRDKVV